MVNNIPNPTFNKATTLKQFENSYIICEKISEMFSTKRKSTKKISLQLYFDNIFNIVLKKETPLFIEGCKKFVEDNYIQVIQLTKYFDNSQIKFMFLSNIVNEMIKFRNSIKSDYCESFPFVRQAYLNYCYFKKFCEIEKENKNE